MDKLSEKQNRFLDEYIIDFNATQAAIRAGYSPRGAAVQANRLLTNANIQVALKQKSSELACKAGVTQQQVVDEYKKIAFEVPVLEYKGSDKLKALEFLARLLNIDDQTEDQNIKITVDYGE